MQTRIHISYFTILLFFLLSVACSVNHLIATKDTEQTQQQEEIPTKEEIIESTVLESDTTNKELSPIKDSTATRKEHSIINDTINNTKKDSLLQTSSSSANIIQNDSTQSDSTKHMFKDVVTYKATDSIKFNVSTQQMTLFNKGHLKYIETELTADSITLNMEENIAYASGVKDSTGTVVGRPVFKDAEQEFESADLKYNFKTEKGFVKNIITQQGEGYIQGQLTKKIDDRIYCIRDGLYTTCDHHDHPHFYIKLNKAKLIKDDKVVSGFANLYIADVPLPLFIPFGFFPITSSGSSGVILPSYGNEQMRGYNFREGGYYWYINDYVDATLTGDIYTNGSWALNAGSNYRKRYKFSGTFTGSMSKNISGEKGDEDYYTSNDWSIRWSHSQDSKSNPYSTFSASVDMSSSSNNYYNSGTNITDIANQRKQSSISWSKKWPDSPFSLTASFSHSQNSSDTTITLSFPNLNLNMSQQYFFRRKNVVGDLKWYENLGITYNASIKNQITTPESELGNSFANMAKDWDNGFKHSVPLSISLNLAPNLSFSPSISYNGVAYLSSIRKGNWVKDTTLTTGGYNPIDTIVGFQYAHNYTTSASMTYNPTIYGMYQFTNPNSKVIAIRHVVSPSASVSYSPNFGVNPNNYWKKYIDANGNEQSYSIFEGKTYGTPTAATLSNESASVNLSLDNNVEMKVRNNADTTGAEEFKKIKLIESFKLSTSYNILADSMNWSNINLAARTSLFNSKMAINISGTIDPYALTKNAIRINKYHGGVGRLTSLTASTGYSFSSGGSKQKEEKNDKLNGNYDNYIDFEVPWNLSFDYTFNYSKSYSADTSAMAIKPISNSTISQMVRLNGGLSLTDKWKLTLSSGYDFEQKEITSTNFSISRDLHCWQMSFTCIPFGTHQSYSFKINVLSSLLQDLKLQKKDSWYDN